MLSVAVHDEEDDSTESSKCTEELSQNVSCSSQTLDGEISSDSPFYRPPAF